MGVRKFDDRCYLSAMFPQSFEVFLEVSQQLNIGAREYFSLLQDYFYEPAQYLEHDPEQGFEKTMIWAQAIPPSSLEKEQACCLIK